MTDEAINVYAVLQRAIFHLGTLRKRVEWNHLNAYTSFIKSFLSPATPQAEKRRPLRETHTTDEAHRKLETSAVLAAYSNLVMAAYGWYDGKMHQFLSAAQNNIGWLDYGWDINLYTDDIKGIGGPKLDFNARADDARKAAALAVIGAVAKINTARQERGEPLVAIPDEVLQKVQ